MAFYQSACLPEFNMAAIFQNGYHLPHCTITSPGNKLSESTKLNHYSIQLAE